MNSVFKKIFLIACGLIFCLEFSFAQKKNSSTGVGLYGGFNFSNISIDSANFTANTKLGHQFGASLRKGKTFYYQLGLEYLVLDSKFSLIDTTTSGSEVEWDRLQVPVNVGINLLPILKSVVNIRFYGGLDPYYTFQIPGNNLDLGNDDFNRLGINATAGAGVDVLVFAVDAGYSLGLNDLLKGNYQAKGNYVFVNLGIRF